MYYHPRSDERMSKRKKEFQQLTDNLIATDKALKCYKEYLRLKVQYQRTCIAGNPSLLSSIKVAMEKCENIEICGTNIRLSLGQSEKELTEIGVKISKLRSQYWSRIQELGNQGTTIPELFATGSIGKSSKEQNISKPLPEIKRHVYKNILQQSTIVNIPVVKVLEKENVKVFKNPEQWQYDVRSYICLVMNTNRISVLDFYTDYLQIFTEIKNTSVAPWMEHFYHEAKRLNDENRLVYNLSDVKMIVNRILEELVKDTLNINLNGDAVKNSIRSKLNIPESLIETMYRDVICCKPNIEAIEDLITDILEDEKQIVEQKVIKDLVAEIFWVKSQNVADCIDFIFEARKLLIIRLIDQLFIFKSRRALVSVDISSYLEDDENATNKSLIKISQEVNDGNIHFDGMKDTNEAMKTSAEDILHYLKSDKTITNKFLIQILGKTDVNFV